MTDEELYKALWETAERFVGDGPECELLTDELWEIVCDDANDWNRQRNYDLTAGFMMGTMWGSK